MITAAKKSEMLANAHGKAKYFSSAFKDVRIRLNAGRRHRSPTLEADVQPISRHWSVWTTVMLFLFMPFPALAWNSTGHRLTACIAWDQLETPIREKIAALLRDHPDHVRWTQKTIGDQDRSAFIEASIWADKIRYDPRFFDPGDEPTPTLPGFLDMQRHRDWHYVNLPVDENFHLPATKGQIDRQLVALAGILGSPKAERLERVHALPWLIHLMGDAHQPLHTIDSEDIWDTAGNNRVSNPFSPRNRRTTLHAYWDDLPGQSSLRGEAFDSVCRTLTLLYPPPKPSSSEQWIKESWLIAKGSAIPPNNGPAHAISGAFHEKATEIARRRIADAGYRLADLLRERLD